MADINEILLRITGDDDDAQKVMRNIIAIMEFLDDEDPEAKVTLEGTGLVLAQTAAIQKGLAALDESDVDIDVEVHQDRDVDRGIRGLTGVLGALGGVAESTGGQLGRVGFSLGPFGAALNPVTAAVAVLVLAIGFALVGALGALVASLAAAVAGLGALAAAFAATLGPSVILAIGVFERLAKVFEAYKATQDAAAASERDRARGTGAVVAATRALEDAQIRLARAAADLEEAETQAYEEIADAAEAARDAVLSLERAQLSQEAAALGVERARLELKKFREEMGLAGEEFDAVFRTFEDVAFDPNKLNKALARVQGPDLGAEEQLELEEKILALKEAKLGEKEATEGVRDATENLTDAQKRYNEFLTDGINASEGYKNALRAQEDAQRALNRAKETAGITAAEAKRQQLVDDLTKSEQELLKVLLRLRKVFDQIFGPAVQAVIRGIADSLGIIADNVSPLRGAFRALGQVMGRAFVKIAKALSTPQMIEFFAVLADAAAQIVPLATGALLALLTILLNIAKAALPLLIPLLQIVADWLEGLAGKTQDADAVRRVIGGLVDHLITWVGLGIDFFNLFFNLFKVAAPFGRQLAEAIGRIAGNLAKWAESAEGRAQLRRFFENAIPFAIEFVRLVFAIVRVLGRMSIIIIDVYNAIATFIGWIDSGLQAVDRFQKRIEDWINQAGDDLVGFLADIGLQMLNAGIEIAEAAFELGKSIIDGIINGIKSAPGKVGQSIVDVVLPGVGLLKRALDAGSPSKVFYDIGTDVTKGFQLGIEETAHKAAASAARALSIPVIQAASVIGPPAMASIGAGAGGGGDIIIEHQDVNLPVAPGHDQMGDARHQAAQFAAEMRKRGRR